MKNIIILCCLFWGITALEAARAEEPVRTYEFRFDRPEQRQNSRIRDEILEGPESPSPFQDILVVDWDKEIPHEVMEDVYYAEGSRANVYARLMNRATRPEKQEES